MYLWMEGHDLCIKHNILCAFDLTDLAFSRALGVFCCESSAFMFSSFQKQALKRRLLHQPHLMLLEGC